MHNLNSEICFYAVFGVETLEKWLKIGSISIFMQTTTNREYLCKNYSLFFFVEA